MPDDDSPGGQLDDEYDHDDVDELDKVEEPFEMIGGALDDDFWGQGDGQEDYDGPIN